MDRHLARTLAVAAVVALALPACAPRHGSADQAGVPSPAASATINITPVDPEETVRDACPATVTFRAKISVSHGPAKVTYAWLDADHARTEIRSAEFRGSGEQSQTVEMTVERRTPGAFGEALTLLTPVRMTADYQNVTLECVPVAVRTISVTPTSHGGTCPRLFRFSGVLRLAPGVDSVRYQWVGGDGVVSEPSTVTWPGDGVREVTVTKNWDLGATGRHWEVLRVLSPYRTESRRAEFTLSCEN
jgi:hypothetical protein